MHSQVGITLEFILTNKVRYLLYHRYQNYRVHIDGNLKIDSWVLHVGVKSRMGLYWGGTPHKTWRVEVILQGREGRYCALNYIEERRASDDVARSLVLTSHFTLHGVNIELWNMISVKLVLCLVFFSLLNLVFNLQ